MSLTEDERDATRLRLKIWHEAQPELRAQRWHELRALTDERALALTKALLGRSVTGQLKRESSGLVEQQALFARLRSR